MNTNLLELPPELWDQTAQNLTFANFIQFWSTGDTIRQKLDTGPRVVKVGRLLLPFCEN